MEALAVSLTASFGWGGESAAWALSLATSSASGRGRERVMCEPCDSIIVGKPQNMQANHLVSHTRVRHQASGSARSYMSITSQLPDLGLTALDQTS
jgi:hypothetical protein